MGLFGRKKPDGGGSGDMQPPDEFALKAQDAYGHQRFAEAFELYTKAVDKLHTMYVMGDARYRQPGTNDTPILSGAVSALGATLAMNSESQVDQMVQSAVNQLMQIARSSSSEGERYEMAAADLEQALRLGRR